ncbi:MAG: hypothetical protein AB2697_00730 [Candidatus Thiodiazotropha endolucinida]
MDIMHNQTFHISGDDLEGIYRVILDKPSFNTTVLVHLNPPDDATRKRSKGGRKRLDNPKRPRKKGRPPNVGKLLWIERTLLEELHTQKLLKLVEIEHRKILPFSGLQKSNKEKQFYERRLKAMEPFLSIDTLREHINKRRGISSLVQIALKNSGLSKSEIYFLFSQLCRFGFSERSLQLGYNNCGAPGVPRPCDPEGRKKAGAKTTKQKLARLQGIVLEPEQPGMSTEWRSLVLAADKKIAKPKPAMPDRITRIIDSAFVKRYRQEADGKLIPVALDQGQYPNRRQIRRVLEKDIPRLQRLLESTTQGHFDRNLRGLTGKDWKGVAGPGHTWAIDSTIGDIYLRSSVNRAWIIGRPIVYILVDVWSTAIVGFYVCLMGPSWAMAKIALFCSAADPELIGSTWGYEPMLTLDPSPTLCANLLCDRGEYLSQGASHTGMNLNLDLAYTPPYRPELKGLVEVLHRIGKDKQYHFVPGAIDARRREFDLRRFNPNEATLTIREFVQLLHYIFSEYNLTADRNHRLDAHMKAANVVPSPSGLWRWGHQVGIGTRRAVLFTDLATNFLPTAEASVTTSGVVLGGRDYISDIINEEQWTAHARNFGRWHLPSYYFPGSVSTIWTPNLSNSELLKLSLSDQSIASPELTWDEVVDAHEYHLINNAEREHIRTTEKLNAQQKRDELIQTAIRLTQAAIERDSGSKPSLSEARNIEHGLDTPNENLTSPQGLTLDSHSPDEAGDAYLQTMRTLLESDNIGETNE